MPPSPLHTPGVKVYPHDGPWLENEVIIDFDFDWASRMEGACSSSAHSQRRQSTAPDRHSRPSLPAARSARPAAPQRPPQRPPHHPRPCPAPAPALPAVMLYMTVHPLANTRYAALRTLGSALSKATLKMGVRDLVARGTLRVILRPLIDTVPVVGAVKASTQAAPRYGGLAWARAAPPGVRAPPASARSRQPSFPRNLFSPPCPLGAGLVCGCSHVHVQGVHDGREPHVRPRHGALCQQLRARLGAQASQPRPRPLLWSPSPGSAALRTVPRAVPWAAASRRRTPPQSPVRQIQTRPCWTALPHLHPLSLARAPAPSHRRTARMRPACVRRPPTSQSPRAGPSCSPTALPPSHLPIPARRPFLFPDGLALDMETLGFRTSAERPEGLLLVTVVGAVHVPRMDLFGRSDPYIM